MCKHPGTQGSTQSIASLQIGSCETLTGNASIVISDPGQPSDQTVIWEQKIKVTKDKSHLIVDGFRVDLPQLSHSESEEQVLRDLLSRRFGASSTPQALFSPAVRVTPKEDDTRSQQIKGGKSGYVCKWVTSFLKRAIILTAYRL